MVSGAEREAAPRARALRYWALMLGCLAAAVALVGLVVVPLTPSFDLWNANVRTTGGDRIIVEGFLVRSTSLVDQRIIAADLQAPGIRIVRTNTPLTIGPDQDRWVQVVYRVTDCRAAVAAATDAPFPMNLRLDRWWGVHTVTLEDHGTDYTGPADVCR